MQNDYSLLDDILMRDRYAKIARGELQTFLAGREFHKMMQDPKVTELVFDGHRPGLYTLRNYWSAQNGKHLFGKTVTKLAIINVPLVLNLQDEVADYRQVAQLIARNPDIREITLTDTELDDKAATALLGALATNHRVQVLALEGNFISKDILNKIEARLAHNKQ